MRPHLHIEMVAGNPTPVLFVNGSSMRLTSAEFKSLHFDACHIKEVIDTYPRCSTPMLEHYRVMEDLGNETMRETYACT